MGSQIPTPPSSPQKWEYVENQNGIEIFKDKNDSKLAQRRRIIILGDFALSQQNKIYQFRASNNFGLVKSYQAIKFEEQNKKNQKITDLCKCSNQKIMVDVYTQRITNRLSDLPQLTFPQSLQILKTASSAFQVAYQKVGGFHINPELIGVTEKGQIRVWVNENWALNRPSHYIPILRSCSNNQGFSDMIPQLRDQSQMISNLISVIQQKNQKGQFPSPFAQLLKSKSTNFRVLKKFLNQYIINNKINLPPIINKSKTPINNQKNPIFNNYSNNFNNKISAFATQPYSNFNSYQISPNIQYKPLQNQSKFLSEKQPISQSLLAFKNTQLKSQILKFQLIDLNGPKQNENRSNNQYRLNQNYRPLDYPKPLFTDSIKFNLIPKSQLSNGPSAQNTNKSDPNNIFHSAFYQLNQNSIQNSQK